jgi:hypothetical protein
MSFSGTDVNYRLLKNCVCTFFKMIFNLPIGGRGKISALHFRINPLKGSCHAELTFSMLKINGSWAGKPVSKFNLSLN